MEVASSNGATIFSRLLAKHNIYKLISKLSRHRMRNQIMIFAPRDEAIVREFGHNLSPTQIATILQHHVGIKDDESERIMKCADGRHFLKFYSSNLGKHLEPDRVEDADIIRGPLEASNAVVYVISRVIHPSKPTLKQLMYGNSDLSTFTSLMRGTGLWRKMQHDMPVNNFCTDNGGCLPSKAFRDRYEEVVKRKQYTILAPTNDAMMDYIFHHENYTQDENILREGIASHVLHGTLLKDSVAPRVARCDASISSSNVMRCIAVANGTDVMTTFHTTKPHIRVISSQRADDGMLYIVGAFKPMIVQVSSLSDKDEAVTDLPVPH